MTLPNINPRIALSFATIGAASALLVGATFAFFSDTATSTGNVLAAESLDLNLDDNDEATPSATVTASLSSAGFAPGVEKDLGFISVHNSGGVDIAEVVFGANATARLQNGGGELLEDVMDLAISKGDDSTCTTNGTDLTGTIATFVGDGFSPLTLRELQDEDYVALPGLTAGSEYFICVKAKMENTAGNEYQGDSVTDDYIFTGNQTPSGGI